MKKILLAICSFFACNLLATADEGMWLLESADKKSAALSGAIVSYDFMGTGSLVSYHGLVVTNHHVVYGDVYALSTEDRNLLRDGFWAYDRKDEIPIPGRSIQILRESIDVTKEVEHLILTQEVKKGPMMMRRLSSIMEKRYEEKTGKTAILSAMWKGSRYFIHIYDNYRDIRLVAAPPEIIGAFGGDEDNWEWPQQKGDFSFVRIYTAPDGSPAEYSENNIPLKSELHLKVAGRNVKEGDKTRVMGFPGRTNRYSGSANVDYLTNVSLPVTVEVRGAQMEILRKWMNADQQVRMKYSDAFFGISNAQELYMGQVACNKRFNVTQLKLQQERELNAWIKADAARTAKWGGLTDSLKKAYEATADIDRQQGYFRECLVRSSRLSAIATRTNSMKRDGNAKRFAGMQRSCAHDYESMDLRVEKEIFRYMLETYMENVSDQLLGPYQRELKAQFGKNYDAMCAELWDGSWMTDTSAVKEYLNPEADLAGMMTGLCSDKLLKFYCDNKVNAFNDAKEKALNGLNIASLNTEYTHALYQMRLAKGVKQYPDANSTLRVSYGKIKGFSPRDAVQCNWRSTVAGLLEKHRPDNHDFCLPDKWIAALKTADPGMTVNFISDDDITGGNSGSPVLNSKGEIIGLAFDGNKESLASDVSFVEDYTRCVCVDIHFVLWTLKNYAHFDALLQEMQIFE